MDNNEASLEAEKSPADLSHATVQPRSRPSYVGYVGPAAMNLRGDGLPILEDLLDLSEDKLWLNPWSTEASMRRGPALALFFACTGASILEATEIVYDPDKPLRGWIDLPGDGKTAPRRVPLPELAAMAIRHYREAFKTAPACDKLFLSDTGGPLDDAALCSTFAGLGERIGIDGGALPARLRHAYIAWTDRSPDTETAYYCRGFDMPKWKRPEDKPSAQAKQDLIKSFHPLGNHKREWLHWEGAVARRDREHPLDELSAADKKELARARAAHYSAAYPKALKVAVRKAIDAGYDPKEVRRHYGVTEGFTKIRQPHPRPDRLAPVEDLIKAKLESSTPPSSEELLEWLRDEHHIVVHHHTLVKRVKKLGLVKRLGRRTGWTRSVIDPHVDEIRALVGDAGVADLKLVGKWLRDEKGIELTQDGLRFALRARGIPVRRKQPIEFPPAAEADVRAWIALDPAPSMNEICRRLKQFHDIDMTHAMVMIRVKALGGKPAAPMPSSLESHLPAIRAYLEANSGTTWTALAVWVWKEFKICAANLTLSNGMRRLGYSKPSCISQTRTQFRPSEDQIARLAARMQETPTPGQLELRLWFMSEWDVTVDPKPFSDFLKKVAARFGLAPPPKHLHGRWTP